MSVWPMGLSDLLCRFGFSYLTASWRLAVIDFSAHIISINGTLIIIFQICTVPENRDVHLQRKNIYYLCVTLRC